MNFFLYEDSPPTDIYTLSLHDALPISWLRNHETGREFPGQGTMGFRRRSRRSVPAAAAFPSPRHLPLPGAQAGRRGEDRKSTRLNSSHVRISYAVFCLKKKIEKSSYVP